MEKYKQADRQSPTDTNKQRKQNKVQQIQTNKEKELNVYENGMNQSLKPLKTCIPTCTHTLANLLSFLSLIADIIFNC